MVSNRKITYFYLIPIAIIISPLFFGLFWLSLVVSISLGIFILGVCAIKLITKKKVKQMVKFFGLFVFIFLNTILFRLMVFDFYAIPTESMRDTLHAGDVIIINKLAYGPRIPISIKEIPWLNVWLYFNNKKSPEPLGIIRKNLSGTSSIQRNDIFVFERKKWKRDNLVKETLVKRCIGLPGDTISIKNGEIYINSKVFPSNSNTRYRFNLWTNNGALLIEKMLALGISKKDVKYNGADALVTITTSLKKIREIRRMKEIDSLNVSIDKPRKKQYLLGKAKNENWTLDNMGPFIIPKKGMEITLNTHTLSLYRRALKIYEGVEVNSIENGLLSKTNNFENYVFKDDYYFVMGDNRKNSFDSRMFGFIPKSNIIGKVLTIISKREKKKS